MVIFSVGLMLLCSYPTINLELLAVKKFFLNFILDFHFTFFGFTIICISCFVLFFIKFYISHEKLFAYFFTLLLIFIASILLIIYAYRFILLFAGWEGLGSSSFLLICYYKNWTSINNSLITLFNNKVGDIILLILGASFLFDQAFAYACSTTLLILLLIIITKRAQFPFMA